MKTTQIMALAFALSLSAVSSTTTCPDGSSPGTVNGRSICCDGTLSVDNGNAACIIGCTVNEPSCVPFCSGTSTAEITSSKCTTVPKYRV
ncbi:hypothetical protein F5Y16DRAFT_357748 [Xylariaceae sp. FL0255]|nr:hypothetical protein F5Y16DRAFT_357748 [Xylariaceae sp. FL0255]